MAGSPPESVILPHTLAETNLLIIGLGLMGGSLALALKPHCRSIVGFDPDPQACQNAVKLGCVDRSSSSIDEILPGAHLIILAAPVMSNLAWLDQLETSFEQPAAILDLSSTKSLICRRMAALPEHFYPIGGHPMCGKAFGGIQHASPDLYKDAVFALVEPRPASHLAAPLILELVAALRAAPLWIEAETHDAWVASTSHLPYLLANALAFVTPAAAFPLVGPGFRSATRLATSSLPMMHDILQSNRNKILQAAQEFQEQLTLLTKLLEREDYPQLIYLLQVGAERQQMLVSSQTNLSQARG